MFHESFFLKSCKNKQQLIQHVSSKQINVDKDTWGEKVPYYPNLKKIPVERYCNKWNEYFKEKSRILHIVRHPYDVAMSNVKKFKHINSHKGPINLYRRAVPNAINATLKMKSCYTFKYEDLLMHPDEMLFNIYSHCEIDPDIDYKKRMKAITNVRYQTIDPSRAFSFLKQDIKFDYDLNSTIKKVNKINGIKYEL